jgi:ssDNA-binding Zn-finger/Zn-ribbon topoisomerase 1
MTSSSKIRTSATQLQCENCGNVQTIHRKRSKMKEKNHLKHLYCFRCKETTKHLEVKEDAYLPDWLRDKAMGDEPE